jgi:alpha-glucosidase (family GH31 glycosyl hydrolase)
MDLRGQRIDMLVKPTLSLYLPFYLSSAGYGLLVEGTWPGHYDFGASDPALVRVEFEGPALHARIWTGPDPAAIVMANARHVGPPVLPPQWAFTPWRWRDAHENKPAYYDGTPAGAPYNSQVVEDVLLMKYFDIPNGVYWIDRPWAKGPLGYDDFDWDPVRMPAARSMIEWIHERGMRLLVWIAPWLTGDLADQAVEQGYALAGQHKGIFRWEHQDAGSLLRIVKRLARRELPGDRDRILVDFTRPGAVGWWQTHTIRKLLEQGVDGFKLDRGEEIVPESRATLAWDGRTARELRNDYPRLYLKAVYDGAHQQRGNDFAAIARAAYTGSSRYGIFWGGDIAATPEGLRAAIVALQRAAVMGYPFWGSDTGGYWQGDPDREVLARWLAFSCFTPIFEVGPTENRGLWDLRTEPAYDIELIAIWRLYAHLHNDLADYTYRHARLARETGMPVVRPLFLEFPEQEQAWREWQGFLYGEDLLVSPVWRKGKTQHEIYLPAGVNWTSAWDGKEYEGGQTISIPTPLYKIPIFLRAGSKLALRDLERTYREGLQIAAQRPDMKALEEAAFGVSN